MYFEKKKYKKEPEYHYPERFNFNYDSINAAETKIGIIIHQPIYYLYFSF